jgi:DNA-binding transcriptional MerR regulator
VAESSKSSRGSRSRRVPESARRKDGLFTTGDMARLTRNTLRTVRFYEEEGLIRPEQRTDGGHRLFAMPELKKLLLITDLRAAGFALEEIREMLHVKGRARTGAAASRDVIARLDEQVRSMNTRVSLLRRLAAELDATRRHLDQCTECQDSRLFPSSCGECRVMKANGEIPDALGVLWGVERT